MFSLILYGCLFIINTRALQIHDIILCRTCGNNIANSNDIIEKRSLSSLNTFNDTLFSRDDVLVQILTKDIIFHFPIVITNHSNCIGLGEWEEQEELWFSGYRWKPCLCPDCGVLVGWILEKDNPLDRFYALILPNLVSLKLLDSIIIGSVNK